MRSKIASMKEWEKKVFPGRKVFLKVPSGEEMTALSFNLLGPTGIECCLEFADGVRGKVNEKMLRYLEVEDLN